MNYSEYERYRVVERVSQVWRKRGAPENAPRTVRFTYRCLPNRVERNKDGTYGDLDCVTVSEWVCPEHTGFARHKFEKWWREHAYPGYPIPDTADEVCNADSGGVLRRVSHLKAKRTDSGLYLDIVGYEFDDSIDTRPFTAHNKKRIEMDDLPF